MHKGGGRVHCKFEDFEMRGSWRMVRVWAGKVASDVELGLFLFVGLIIKMAGRLLWTPYPDQKSPWAKLGKNSQNRGTLKSAIKSAGLNAPAY